MDEQDRIEVIDSEGWRKIYPLQRPIIHIGSHPRNDIILEQGHGAGVADTHVQLITAADHRPGYRLVNLADSRIFLGLSDGQTLMPHQVIEIYDGDSFRLGDFTLFLYVGDGNGGGSSTDTSRNIGLDLSLPQTRLAPDQAFDGIVKVQNLGEQTGVQFELEVLGLDHDCYDLEPGPLLSAGAEKDVIIHLYHRGIKPPAGELEITILATASRAYPGEQVSSSQVIEILPAYRHELRLLHPGEVSR